MALLRTKQLALRQVDAAGTVTDLYTVPADHRAVLRDVALMVSSSSGSNVVQLRIRGSGGPTVFLAIEQPANAKVVHWQGQAVLQAGDVVELYTATAPCYVIASGAELPVSPS